MSHGPSRTQGHRLAAPPEACHTQGVTSAEIGLLAEQWIEGPTPERVLVLGDATLPVVAGQHSVTVRFDATPPRAPGESAPPPALRLASLLQRNEDHPFDRVLIADARALAACTGRSWFAQVATLLRDDGLLVALNTEGLAPDWLSDELCQRASLRIEGGPSLLLASRGALPPLRLPSPEAAWLRAEGVREALRESREREALDARLHAEMRGQLARYEAAVLQAEAETAVAEQRASRLEAQLLDGAARHLDATLEADELRTRLAAAQGALSCSPARLQGRLAGLGLRADSQGGALQGLRARVVSLQEALAQAHEAGEAQAKLGEQQRVQAEQYGALVRKLQLELNALEGEAASWGDLDRRAREAQAALRETAVTQAELEASVVRLNQQVQVREQAQQIAERDLLAAKSLAAARDVELAQLRELLGRLRQRVDYFAQKLGPETPSDMLLSSLHEGATPPGALSARKL